MGYSRGTPDGVHLPYIVEVRPYSAGLEEPQPHKGTANGGTDWGCERRLPEMTLSRHPPYTVPLRTDLTKRDSLAQTVPAPEGCSGCPARAGPGLPLVYS